MPFPALKSFNAYTSGTLPHPNTSTSVLCLTFSSIPFCREQHQIKCTKYCTPALLPPSIHPFICSKYTNTEEALQKVQEPSCALDPPWSGCAWDELQVHEGAPRARALPVRTGPSPHATLDLLMC